MKTFKILLSLAIITLSFSSCKSDQQKKAEIVTNNYVRFVDSVTNIGRINAVENWNAIAKSFDKKSNELNIEIDKLEDVTIYDKKINPATAKYENFRNLAFEKKLERKKDSPSK
ncbi:hypothetical protein [Flavobacterium sp. GP15]|uniref:hypothetical protein n=1 Tax=Flavobacterium sp. GP15 TaxID=2758567 RepID=UPI00165D91BE|nr:hypothetical protein [Flavobacterium sp. GP15]